MAEDTSGSTAANTAEPSPFEIRSSRVILLAGVGFGVLADLLIWNRGPAATGFALWVLLFACGFCCWSRLNRTLNPVHALLWSAVAVIAAILMVLRSSDFLFAGMWLLILTSFIMLVLQLRQNDPWQLRIETVVTQAVSACLDLLYHFIPVVQKARLRELTSFHDAYVFLRAGMILLPLLLIFSYLFAAADAVFERHTSYLLGWLAEDLIQHAIRFCFFAWMATGLVSVLNCSKPSTPGRAFPLKPGPVEVNIVLGGLTLLFGVFVMLQLPYLFGGRNVIEQTTGLTLAEYARRGFFELLAVAGLALSILYVFAGSCANQTRFRILAFIMIGCVLLMQASAVQRLLIYVAAFGLTFDRVIAFTVLLWLCTVLLLFAGTVLRSRPRGFLYSGICAGVFLAVLCTALNPAALVTRVNVNHALNTGRALDHAYLLRLGPDAVPALLESVEELPQTQQCFIATSLAGRRYHDPQRDWRSFNWARWRADKALAAKAAFIQSWQERLDAIEDQPLPMHECSLATAELIGVSVMRLQRI